MKNESPWEDWLLEAMEPGSVTFGWDDREVRTIAVPEGTLKTMQSAWDWIGARLIELEKERGKPRMVCFRLDNGQFRGLRFPDWNPGSL
ncbi:MAG: hypothetical protein RDU20_10740 [Desulfomonilaceae bacterium]|nr:hypothetical protein [Desulfomonilaceae bacterium]